jgi:putative membrane protein
MATRFFGVSVVAVAAMMGACGGRTDSTTTRADSTAAADSAARAAAQSTPALSDANVVALLDEANMADSATAADVMSKLTNAEVKAYAKMMMSDHHQLRVKGQELATRLSVTPQMPANDPFVGAVSAEKSALDAATKGRGLDSTYIANEITIHKAVIAFADSVEGKVQNDSLRELIKGAKPTIQMHLDHAQDLEKKLAKVLASR